MKFIVQLTHRSWLAPWKGDPGRTLKIESAKKFDTYKKALSALNWALEQRDYRDAKIISMDRNIPNRKQWFLDRVGKKVYRNDNGCKCPICEDVAYNGIIIGSAMHANYLYDIECGYNADGHPLKYTDHKGSPDLKNTKQVMKKIGSKDLISYLNYGLNIKPPENFIFNGTRTDLEKLTLHGIKGDYVCFKETSGFYPIHLFKPILRPLSDLTKTIKLENYNNGEEFIPIVEMAKIADCHFVNIPKLKGIEEFEEDGCKVIQVHWEDDREKYFEFSYGLDDFEVDRGKNDGFTMTLRTFWAIHNPGKVIDFMHMCHFDTKRLIKSGLAIDINDLNN